MNSAAEIATGIVCVCLPTLGALRHCTSKGPTQSIINGISRSATIQSHRWGKSANFNHQDLISGEYMEMEERSCQAGDQLPTNLVVTEIQGGPPLKSQDCGLEIQDHAPIVAGNGSSQSVVEGRILKTMTIAQSRTSNS